MMPATKNRNWLPSLFNDFFGDEWLALPQYKRMTTPAINVIENEHDYTVEVAAPGMTKEDFHIDLNADSVFAVQSIEFSIDDEPFERDGKINNMTVRGYLFTR